MYYSLISSMKKATAFSYDADALAFFTATGITDTTQKSAVNTLVLDLKGYSIWTKMKAIYPMVGGTATTHKYNLKDPRDLDAAFRLTFNGGWTHASTGAKPNGSNGYADTFLKPNIELTLNNTGISYYGRNVKTGALGLLIGSGFGSSELSIYADYSGTDYFANNCVYATGSNLLASKTGLIHNTRIASTGYKIYLNGVVKYSPTTTSSSLNNQNIFIARVGGDYATVECSFSAIDTGLTDTESANLYTAVQNFNTTLSRQV